MTPDELKHCPLCNSDLSIGEFGICRARHDGRNLYCRSCIRNKVTESRRALKEYKSARKRRIKAQLSLPEPEPVQSFVTSANKTPVERVRDAIRLGCRTQRELLQETKLHKDALCDALTIMLLWDHEIQSRIINDERVYFFPEIKSHTEVRRKQDVLSGFSGIQAIMPERKRA